MAAAKGAGWGIKESHTAHTLHTYCAPAAPHLLGCWRRFEGWVYRVCWGITYRTLSVLRIGVKEVNEGK